MSFHKVKYLSGQKLHQNYLNIATKYKWKSWNAKLYALEELNLKK